MRKVQHRFLRVRQHRAPYPNTLHDTFLVHAVDAEDVSAAEYVRDYVLLHVPLVVSNEHRREPVGFGALFIQSVSNRAGLGFVLFPGRRTALNLRDSTYHARDATSLAPDSDEIRLFPRFWPVRVVDVHGDDVQIVERRRQRFQHGGQDHGVHAAGERDGDGFGRHGIRTLVEFAAEERLHRLVHRVRRHGLGSLGVGDELVKLQNLVAVHVLLALQVLQAPQGGLTKLGEQIRALRLGLTARVESLEREFQARDVLPRVAKGHEQEHLLRRGHPRVPSLSNARVYHLDAPRVARRDARVPIRRVSVHVPRELVQRHHERDRVRRGRFRPRVEVAALRG